MPTWVYEDSGTPGINDKVKAKFPAVQFIEPTERTGQIVAQDALWAKVTTPYALTWEEDWETYKGGFLQRALEIMDNQEECVQVLFRHPSDNNQHPTVPGGLGYRYLSTSWGWKGFSFSPSLKRLSDYKAIGSYGEHTTFNPKIPWQSEKAIGELYHSMGYRAAILKDGFVRHIGKHRHVK